MEWDANTSCLGAAPAELQLGIACSNNNSSNKSNSNATNKKSSSTQQ